MNGDGQSIVTAGASIRHAEGLMARAEADERAASEARARIRAHGLARLTLDTAVVGLLGPGEDLVAHRPSVVVERHLPQDLRDDVGGALYVSTRRLLLVGRTPLSVDLADIHELSVVGERLLLTLRGDVGLSIQASEPRVLRVEIAAAIEAARA